MHPLLYKKNWFDLIKNKPDMFFVIKIIICKEKLDLFLLNKTRFFALKNIRSVLEQSKKMILVYM